MESAGVWLVKFGDLEISSISSFETWGWRKTGNWSLVFVVSMGFR